MALLSMPLQPRKVLRVNMWSSDKQGTVVRTSCLKESTYKGSPEARCIDFLRETDIAVTEWSMGGWRDREGRCLWQMLPSVLIHRAGA